MPLQFSFSSCLFSRRSAFDPCPPKCDFLAGGGGVVEEKSAGNSCSWGGSLSLRPTRSQTQLKLWVRPKPGKELPGCQASARLPPGAPLALPGEPLPRSEHPPLTRCWTRRGARAGFSGAPQHPHPALGEAVANTNKFHFQFPVRAGQPEGFAFHFWKNKVQLNLCGFLLAWVLLQSGLVCF